MVRNTYTDAEKQAAVELARTMGSTQAAAEALGIDWRSIRGWMAKYPEGRKGDGAWEAAQQLAQQHLLTALASGRVTNPSQLATVAGISSRNVAFGERWRQAEARRREREEAAARAEFEEEVGRISTGLLLSVRQIIGAAMHIIATHGTLPEALPAPELRDDMTPTEHRAAVLAYIDTASRALAEMDSATLRELHVACNAARGLPPPPEPVRPEAMPPPPAAEIPEPEPLDTSEADDSWTPPAPRPEPAPVYRSPGGGVLRDMPRDVLGEQLEADRVTVPGDHRLAGRKWGVS